MMSLVATLMIAGTPTVPARQAGVPIGKGKKKPKVTLTSPRGGWTAGRMMTVAGEISDRTVDPITLSINGDRYFVRTRNGRFRRKFPAASGKNVITAIATNRGGTTTAQVTTYAEIPSVPLKTILTSDTDGVWTDLHIYEPTTATRESSTLAVGSMAHVYWANTESPSGGTFYLNDDVGGFDQPGYGPYLYVHRAPPTGVFFVATNYYPSGDKAHTEAMLNVSLFEGTAKEARRKVRVPLATPGTTKVLAVVNFTGPDQAQIFVPGQDPWPKGEGWPDNLPEAIKEAEGNAAGSGGY